LLSVASSSKSKLNQSCSVFATARVL